MLKFALLGFLSYQPMTGYELERTMRNTIENVWSAQLSQIYRTLRQLEDDGLVSSAVEPQEGRPDRRVYSATDEGRAGFDAWRRELVTDRDVIRSQFMVRFFFAGGRPVDDTLAQLRVMRDLYVRQRDQFAGETAQQVAATKDVFPDGALEPVIWEATRRAGELHAQTWVDWIDETVKTLESHRS